MTRKPVYNSKLAEEFYNLSVNINSISISKLNFDEAIFSIILKKYLFNDEKSFSNEENFYEKLNNVNHILYSIKKGLLEEENEFLEEFLKEFSKSPDFDRHFKNETDFKSQLNDHLKPKRFLTKIESWVFLVNILWIPFGLKLLFGPLISGVENIHASFFATSLVTALPAFAISFLKFVWVLIWLLSIIIGILFSFAGPSILAEIIFRTKESKFSKIMERF